MSHQLFAAARFAAVRRLAPLALLTAGLLTTPPAIAANFSLDEQTAIERVVRDYLVKNPEVLLEAMQALEKRQQVMTEEKTRDALSQFKDKIFNDPASPVGGNPRGDVTVVEFFDYQCGYCKSVHDDALKLVREDSRVRYVYKEFPILGPGSTIAAKAALAARIQGKYLEVHNALMSHRGRLDEPTVLRLAGEAGANVDKLKSDMNSSAINDMIAANLELAEKLNIHGTPGFIIGDQLAPGAIKLDEMKRMVAEARRK